MSEIIIQLLDCVDFENNWNFPLYNSHFLVSYLASSEFKLARAQKIDGLPLVI